MYFKRRLCHINYKVKVNALNNVKGKRANVPKALS